MPLGDKAIVRLMMLCCIVTFSVFDGWDNETPQVFSNWGEASEEGVLSASEDAPLVSDRPEKATPSPLKSAQLPEPRPSSCKRFVEIPKLFPPQGFSNEVHRTRPPPHGGAA